MLGLSCSMNMKMPNPQDDSINKASLPIKKWCQQGRRWQNSLPKDEEVLAAEVLPASTNSSLPWRWSKPESSNAQQKEQLFAKGSNARWGRQELVATVGQTAAALVWYILIVARVVGQLLATCLFAVRIPNGFPCVATSERILLSIQKLQTLPYGCYTINQGTYWCYFCSLMLTIPQQFCFCLIHNIKKRSKSLTSLGYIKLVSVQIDRTEDAC